MDWGTSGPISFSNSPDCLVSLYLKCSVAKCFGTLTVSDIGMNLTKTTSTFSLSRLGGTAASGGETPPKDKKGLKEWVRNKLKAFSITTRKIRN